MDKNWSYRCVACGSKAILAPVIKSLLNCRIEEKIRAGGKEKEMKRFKQKVPFVGMIDMTLYSDVNILVGESGCGKTQLLKAMSKQAGIEMLDSTANYVSVESIRKIKPVVRKLYGRCFKELEKKHWQVEEYYSSASRYFLNFLSGYYYSNGIFIADDVGHQLHSDDAACLINICREMTKKQIVVSTHNPALVMDHWFGQLVDVEKCIEA